jgi:hypothetical protein
MLNKEGLANLRQRLNTIKSQATTFFTKAHTDIANTQDLEYHPNEDLWSLVPQETRDQGETIRTAIKQLSVDIAGAARGAPLVAEADLQDLRHNTRRMLASIYFRKYRHFGVYVHSYEDQILGVDPPSQEETPLTAVGLAESQFNNACTGISELIDLLSPAESIPATRVRRLINPTPRSS